MKNLILFITLFLASVLFSNCNKDDDSFDISQITGNLVVNAKDGVNDPLSNRVIYLYQNQADFNNNIYSQKKTANSQGQAKFVNLSPGVYYVDTKFENLLGFTVNVSGSGSVSAGFETTITIRP